MARRTCVRSPAGSQSLWLLNIAEAGEQAYRRLHASHTADAYDQATKSWTTVWFVAGSWRLA